MEWYCLVTLTNLVRHAGLSASAELLVLSECEMMSYNGSNAVTAPSLKRYYTKMSMTISLTLATDPPSSGKLRGTRNTDHNMSI